MTALTKQGDVLGWGATEWGMSESQILQLLQSDAKKLDPPVEYTNPTRFSNIGILNRDIGGKSFAIHFLFNQTKGLDEVMIKPNSEQPFGYFELLYQLLSQKYGPATLMDRDEKINITDTVIWRFPSTVIELKRIDSSVLNLLFTALHYCPATSRDLSFI